MPSITKYIKEPKSTITDFSKYPPTWVKKHFTLKEGRLSPGYFDKRYQRVLFSPNADKHLLLGEQIAWCIYYGEWPKHPVRPKDLNFLHLSKDNLFESPDGSVTVEWD